MITADQIGKSVSFKYNGRDIKCIVQSITDTGFYGQLQTDYKGKKEFWEKGESKHFISKKAKQITFK